MKVCNLGSLNIDLVYRVPHIVLPGETLGSSSLERFAGGKGANQSVALARAGAEVHHCGRVGADGTWLVELLAGAGVETGSIHQDAGESGHAIIQVADDAENSILLFPGANHRIEEQAIEQALDGFGAGDVLLTQNETVGVAAAMQAANRKGVRVWFNPAPYDDAVAALPLECVDTLIVNETEGMNLAGLGADASATEIVDGLLRRYPQAAVVFTRGAEGVLWGRGDLRVEVAAESVPVVDTTAAGDTFVGYFLAHSLTGAEVADALRIACRAAAITVGRMGAIPAIPTAAEVMTSA